MPTAINLSSTTTPQPQGPVSDTMTKLLNEKKSGREFQLRKHADWNENYELNRNKVKTNRLTQRQAVNIPIMRETIKTLLSKVDDPPEVQWKEKSGDQTKEIIYQQMWDDAYRTEDLELKDILDKKNVFLYGLSTKKLNLHKKGVCIDIMDVFDVVFDPLTDPLNIESARFIIHQNIFKPLREVLADDRYSKKGKDALKEWLASDKGIIQSGKNKEAYEKKMERLRSMGLQHEKFSTFAGGDVIVNLTEHFTNIWNTKKQEFERRVVTYADDTIDLSDDLLEDCIGITEWPFEFWSEDPETNDVYPDSLADLIRTPNKILNIWVSQMVENRTLANMGMHWYDATANDKFVPQTYEPGQGRMLPAPGDPNKTIMPVQFNTVSDDMESINFLTNIVERATGATAIEKGQAESGAQTLGEIEILVGKAGERSKTISKFYKHSWYRTAKKWDAMMQANNFPKMTLFKTGRSGKVYEKVVYTSDWKSEAGYEPAIESSSEQEADALKNMQKFGYVIAQNPNNIALRKILQQRQLKLLDLSVAELDEIEEAEDQLMQQASMAAQPAPEAAAAPAQPQQGAPMEQGVDPGQLQELASLTA